MPTTDAKTRGNFMAGSLLIVAGTTDLLRHGRFFAKQRARGTCQMSGVAADPCESFGSVIEQNAANRVGGAEPATDARPAGRRQ
jgi:hypothetical protein